MLEISERPFLVTGSQSLQGSVAPVDRLPRLDPSRVKVRRSGCAAIPDGAERGAQATPILGPTCIECRRPPRILDRIESPVGGYQRIAYSLSLGCTDAILLGIGDDERGDQERDRDRSCGRPVWPLRSLDPMTCPPLIRAPAIHMLIAPGL